MSREDCSGKSGVNLMNIWTGSNDCWNLYYELMYNNSGRPGYSTTGFELVKDDVNSLIANYIGQGYSITQHGEDGYNVFQDVLLKICNAYPGSCGEYLTNFCSTVSNVDDNTGLINFCGCYANQQDYSGNVTTQCQPLCNRVSTVKLPDNNGGILTCKDNVCVIDKVSINASKTQLGGNVSFTQVCRCPEGNCKCIIGSVDVYSITGASEFKQVCGDASLCYTITDNPNDPPVLTTCPTALEPSTTSSNTTISGIIWFIMIIVVFVVFLLFIII